MCSFIVMQKTPISISPSNTGNNSSVNTCQESGYSDLKLDKQALSADQSKAFP